MIKKIHYHSDCRFFAGCENMLVNFFDSKELNENYELSFSFRDSEDYRNGFYKRVKSKINYFPLNLPYIKNIVLPLKLHNNILERLINIIIRVLTNFPILIYEVLILMGLFLKIKPDIVHVNSGGFPPTMSAKAALIASHLCRVRKTILVVNNLAKEYDSFSRIIDYPIDRFIARKVDYFITGSTVAANQLKKVLLLKDNKILNIYNGIDIRSPNETKVETLTRLDIQKNLKVFGVVALLIPRKGHKVLIDAIELIVKSSMTNFIVLIEGSGLMREELERLVSSKNLTKFCKFIGNEDNVIDFIEAVDCVILPSIRDEDFPNVILESMSLGKVILASNLAGIPEQIIDKETGFLFTPGDYRNLANIMIEIISENIDINFISSSTKKRFEENFTAKLSVNNYINLYNRILKI
jgi:glycosyltransferase involved in cell wall biosynthesis